MKTIIEIENDYISNFAFDHWVEEINYLVNEENVFAKIKNNDFNNTIEDQKRYQANKEDFKNKIVIESKGYSQSEWQTTILYYNDLNQNIKSLIELIERSFTHKNDYFVNKYEIIEQNNREYKALIDSTSFTIDSIEFPDNNDIIESYNEIYGVDYDEFNILID